MISSVERLTEAIAENQYTELIEYIKDLHRPLEYFIEEAMNSGPGVRKELYSRYRRTKMILEELMMLPDKRIIRVRKPKNDIDDIK